MAATQILFLAFLAMTSSLAIASDPSPLQDFCVADNTSAVLVNGFVCKNPAMVSAEDFFFSGLRMPGDTSNPLGSKFNNGPSNAIAIAGLSSQNPGVITIANAVFGSKPPISDEVLAKAFQVSKETVDKLQAQFWPDNN
ncbi:hypothetical protein J5N97_009031 [Dioscorea zingiberensis]|uniref:Cupin type-1 domain-containing protein n=1 Tax=Dioscorea zingiberensis TaxID=325984 RepID=A0A9D5HLK6_9LILI|nr:hypothetical protein J5N97_009031 [Dioscorea zingiberensis]